MTPALHPHWRVPDSVFRWFMVAVVILTWTLLILAYPILPAVVPQHFNFSGAVDAMTVKTWWWIFMPGMLQLVITAAMWWLSYHPEYSNLPTSLPLRAVPEPLQTKLKALLSHLLVMVGVLTDLVFAYLAFGVVRVGLGEASSLNGWVLFGLAAGILFLTVVYSLWIARLLRSQTT